MRKKATQAENLMETQNTAQSAAGSFLWSFKLTPVLLYEQTAAVKQMSNHQPCDLMTGWQRQG